MRFGWAARRLGAGVLCLCLVAGAAMAQERQRPRAVVELFTSQGCGSCPPADALLGELARDEAVVALAYHVDYWDYLGWKDALARPENTARQRAYAGSLGRSSVYTPQMVVNGRRDVNGAARARVIGALDAMAGGAEGLSVDVAIEDTGESLVIDIGALPQRRAPAARDAHVLLVDFVPEQAVAIRAGENRGRTVEYRNAVTGIRTIGMWDGAAMTIELPKAEIMREGGGCAVLVQIVTDGAPGPILGASVMRAAPS